MDAFDDCVVIEFEYFEYTYECDAIEVEAFGYPTVFAHDTHNEMIDVCERVFYEAAFDSVDTLEMCCTPDERIAMIDGCGLVTDSGLFDDISVPDLCSEVEDSLCASLDSTQVASYNVFYDSCDFSYNCAEQTGYDINYEDTTPPIIGSSCEANVWTEDVEKCTYYDEAAVSAFDRCDLEVEVYTSITYGCSVTFGDVDGEGYMVGAESQQYGTGGIVVSEVDEMVTGTYCLEYNAADDSNNRAWRETYVVEVKDTLDCEIAFETEYYMHECGVDTDIIDYGESSSNWPCSDEPEMDLTYTFDGNHKITYGGDMCDDMSAVNYNADDSEGNYCSGCTYFEIEDTTPPTITCPGDIEVETEQNGGVWECDYDGVFSDCIAEADDSCDDGFSQDDNQEVVDMRTIGTYVTTYTVEDDAGNTASCDHTTIVIDSMDCLCDANACSPYVEACEDQYIEMGAYCYDLYDGDISHSDDAIEVGDIGYVVNAGPNDEGAGTCEDGSCVDTSSPGDYTVYYWASDSSGNTCEASVVVTVDDVTPPVLTFNTNDETVWLEASYTDDTGNYLGVYYEATCDDTCDVGSFSFDASTLDYEYALSNAVTMDSYIATEGSCGDLACNSDNGFTFSGDDDVLGYGSGFKGYVDESHYYCGGDYDTSEAVRAEAVAAQDFDWLATSCAIYEVVFTCSDVNGNDATLTEYVVTVDTTSPLITTYLFSDTLASGTFGGSIAFVGLVAAVAAVAYKAGSKTHNSIPL